MKHLVLILPIALAALGLSAPASAGAQSFDAQMEPVLEQYLTIQGALAGDQLEGVQPAARRIAKLAAKADASTVTGEHAGHFAQVPANVKEAATRLAAAKDLESARAAFKDLSKPMAMWASMSEPEGVSVMYCSMAEGSWLQKGTELRNPYYGASMLTCGEIVGGAGAKAQSGHGDHGGHGGHGHMH